MPIEANRFDGRYFFGIQGGAEVSNLELPSIEQS